MALETELRNDIKAAENQTREIQNDFEKKQQEIEQMLREQQKSYSEHQSKVRHLENELDEQRRETVRFVDLSFSFSTNFVVERLKNGTGTSRDEVSRADRIVENSTVTRSRNQSEIASDVPSPLVRFFRSANDWKNNI